MMNSKFRFVASANCSGFAVWGKSNAAGLSGETVKDGDLVEVIGDIKISVEDAGTEDEYEIAYRLVKLQSGFVGEVLWQMYDGSAGFVEI